MQITKMLLIIIIPLFLFGCSQNIEKTKKEISVESQKIVREYLKNNISELSPQKENLGGKFYITKIDFPDLNTAIVNYEDGHEALKAKLIFSINNQKLEVKNFSLIKNEIVITNEEEKCDRHEDCVPLTSCHSHRCINKKYINNYQQEKNCPTKSDADNCAADSAEDCICQQGICFNENLMNKECHK